MIHSTDSFELRVPTYGGRGWFPSHSLYHDSQSSTYVDHCNIFSAQHGSCPAAVSRSADNEQALSVVLSDVLTCCQQISQSDTSVFRWPEQQRIALAEEGCSWYGRSIFSHDNFSSI